jgi:hypothetical protein
MTEPEAQSETPDAIVPENEAMSVEASPFEGEDNSADMDEVLDRLLGIDASAPRRESRTQEASAPANDPDIDRALKALQRDGVPADVIEAAKSDPSKLKEWGLKAAKRQADVDSFGAKAASKKDEGHKTAEKPQASVATGDGEADADPLSEFGSIFGDEATKPLRQITERLKADFDEKTRVLEVRYETRSAYERLASEYGASSPSFDEIADAAAKLGRENPAKFNSVADIVKEAFRKTAGEPKKIDPRNIARPSIGKPPARTIREIDKEDLALDILLSGGSRADAIKAITR